MNEQFAKVYVTDNYKMFRHLEGNRDVKDGRVAGIINSISKIGYVCSPIIVNEKMEVIDGQGRFEAAKRLNLPVYYLIVKGIGLDECRAMNIKQSNWTTDDFIKSYCTTGDQNYIYLSQLYKEFKKDLGADTLIGVVTDRYGSGKETCNSLDIIRNGELEFTEEDYAEARKLCAYLRLCSSEMKEVGGRKINYFKILRFCYQQPSIDHLLLLEKIKKMKVDLLPTVNVAQAAEIIEKVYNYKNRDKKYIASMYRKEMDERMTFEARMRRNKDE